MAVSGDKVAVSVVAHHAVACAHFLAADAVKAPGTRAFASGVDETRSAHTVAGLWVALAAVSARIWARLSAVGAELTRLAWPITLNTVPPYENNNGKLHFTLHIFLINYFHSSLYLKLKMVYRFIYFHFVILVSSLITKIRKNLGFHFL
jgi:hypothetical protein